MKGSIFTIEALFGTLLFILFVISISAYTNHLKEDTWTIPDERLADDLLIVLEKEGTLAASNSTIIENEIGFILGNSSRFRLEITGFNYSGGTFVNISQSSIGAALSNTSEIMVAERGFFSVSDGSVSDYSIARLYIWK